MQVSYSKIECFEKCKYKYQLRYLEEIKTIPPDNADNALILGSALHTGMEKGVQTAIEQYFMSYPIITDEHINEAMKLECLIPKAKAVVPEGEFEVKIENEHFIGFIDLLVPASVFKRGVVLPNQYDLYDFKYSNNVNHYKNSKQLHLYKYFFELLNPGKFIRNMYFLFIPKVNVKQKKTENIEQFRKRLLKELKDAEPKLIQIEYNYNKVIEYLISVKEVIETKDFKKEPNWSCNYCDYSGYCQKGEDYMLLPKNERRNIEKVEKRVLWLYGSPFSGKTTFANKFPDPLMLNTDGNIKFVDAPFIPIKDEVKVTGRITNRTLAWQIFKDVIAELEKKENDFKTIIVDLLEDTYEYCRLYIYEQMNITHESDDSFRAWDKVRTEFLSTLKKLMALDYENIILISHEDTSKDITKKGGDKITAIKPNLQEKAANKVAGMVDIVARVIADDNKRVLSFKTNEVIFGGGRLMASVNEIDLDFDEFLAVYDEANKQAANKMKEEEPAKVRTKKKVEEKSAEPEKIESEEKTEEVEDTTEVEETDEKSKTEEPTEEKPKIRVRKRREN